MLSAKLSGEMRMNVDKTRQSRSFASRFGDEPGREPAGDACRHTSTSWKPIWRARRAASGVLQRGRRDRLPAAQEGEHAASLGAATHPRAARRDAGNNDDGRRRRRRA